MKPKALEFLEQEVNSKKVLRKLPFALYEVVAAVMEAYAQPTFYLPSVKPIPAPDDPLNSVDVFIMDEDGMHGLAYYSFEDKKWCFHTDTLVDYNEPGSETKWVWYYPPYNKEDVKFSTDHVNP